MSTLRPLRLDYQHRANFAVIIGVALLATGLAAVLLAISYFYSLGNDIALWEAKITIIERSARHQSVSSPKDRAGARQADAEMKEAYDVLLHLALPWDELFRTVESSNDDRVALLSIEPDAQKRLVRISGEARSLDCMLNYVRVLQESGLLSEVDLKSHQIYQQDPDKPIRFSLVAAWMHQP